MALFGFVIGLCIGSFVNAAVFRMRWPHQGSLIRERSHCPRCHTTLPWYDLIPVLSFVWLRARCRFCHKRISWQYPAVELATAALFALATIYPEHATPTAVVGAPLEAVVEGFPFAFGATQAIFGLLIRWFSVSVLLFLAVYDLRYGLLPDRVTIPAALTVFLSSLVLSLLRSGTDASCQLSFVSCQLPWVVSYLGAVVLGAAFFAIQYLVSKGRWVGGGDIRMGALVGAIVGWPGVFVALATSYMVGAFTAAALLLAGKKKLRGDTLPMGPFLAVGALFAMFFGAGIVQAVLYPYRYL